MIKKNVGVIGYGAWAQKILPIIQKLCNINFITNSKIDYKILNLNVDWIIVLTNNKTHFPIVKYLLKKGKNVICEKPLTQSYKKSQYLYKLAKKKKAKLYVNDVEFYKYKKIKILKNNIIIRSKKNSFAKGNLLFRLAYHDFYLLRKYLDSQKIEEVITFQISQKKLKFSFNSYDKKFNFLYIINDSVNRHMINKTNLLEFKFDPLTKMFKSIFNNKADYERNKIDTLFASKIISQLNKYGIK
jgi:hypothetical protein